MGGLCTRMDSIEHAKNIEDIKNIIQSDCKFFQEQLYLLQRDPNLREDLKEKKVKYFETVVSKFTEYHNHLSGIPSLKELEVIELKIKYKHLMKEIDSLQYAQIDNFFNEFETDFYHK